MHFKISLTDQSAFTWKDFRMRNRLRIFPANESIQCQEPTTVTLKLGEVLEPLADAFGDQSRLPVSKQNDQGIATILEAIRIDLAMRMTNNGVG